MTVSRLFLPSDRTTPMMARCQNHPARIDMKSSLPLLLCFALVLSLTPNSTAQQDSKSNADSAAKESSAFMTVKFASEDGLEITGELYQANADKQTPFIVLCHQAGWSRGEYREIAPKLNKMGFNCLAIDQRSGGGVNNVTNETVARAKSAKKGTAFLDAEQDMIAAVKWAKANYASGNVILWGSSYSSALALRIAGEHNELVNGVMSFAPGEYFVRFGKPKNWIQTSAAKIKSPAFITSAKNEFKNWKNIFEAIPGDSKVKFVPQTKGNHGSRALWEKFADHGDYWKSVEGFLTQFK